MKKIISTVVILVMALSLCTAVFAVDSEKETKGDFVYIKGTNTITQYIGTTGICEIPEGAEVIGLQKQKSENPPITKLIINSGVSFKQSLVGEANRFESLKEVILKEGVTEIPYQAFANCDALEKITIPSTVTEVGEEAFSQCKSLKSIEMSEGLKTINDLAFSHLPSLSGDVIIPDSVTAMGHGVFSHCGDLNKVHISANVQYKPTNLYHDGRTPSAEWFYYTNIKEINIPDSMLENPTCYFNADDITFNSDMTVAIYNAVKNSSWYKNKYLKGKTDKSMGAFEDYSIVQDTVLKYIGTDKNPTVPEGIKTIGDNAFSYCDIDTVTLPTSLETIDEAAFYYTTIKSIVIPESVKSIEDLAFDNCPYLEKMVIEGTPEIGLNAVVISNVLTEDNITAGKATIQKILENGMTTYDDLTSFYDILNRRRKELGFAEIVTPAYAQNETKATAQPQTTENPKATMKPKETSNPLATAEPEATPTPQMITVHGGNDIAVSVDNEAVTFPDAQPFIDDNNRTQIPIRAVAEMLDSEVKWDGETETVTITNGNSNTVTLQIDSDIMTVNGKSVQMDTAAIIKNERTYIPVRFVAEAMGLTVEWKN